MTTTQNQPAISATEVLHPWWCDGGKDCQDDLAWLDSVEHLGEPTTWETITADTRISLQLARYDDHETHGQQRSSQTQAQLGIKNTGGLNEDGSKIVVATYLDVTEVDQLIRFLGQYRAKMAHANDHQYDVGRDELPI